MREFLADAVLAFHLLWVAIIMVGIILSVLFKWYRPIHVAVLGTTVLSQLLWQQCPLTILEMSLRDPSQSIKGSFVVHYLKEWFGVTISPVFVLEQLLLFFALAVILVIWTYVRKQTRTPTV